MMPSSAPAWLAGYLSAALLTACGGSAQVPSSTGIGGAANGSAGSKAAAGSTSDDSKTPCYGGCATHPERPKPTAPPECPSSEPAAGTACTSEAIRCSYGDSRAVQCRHLYQCTNSAWQADTSISQRYSCDPLPADYCPAAPQHRQPCTIANVGMPCTYGELSCVCSARSPAPGKTGNWLCYGPPANPACPAAAANVGDGCSGNGLACDYDADACTAAPTSSLLCVYGSWQQGQGYNCAI